MERFVDIGREYVKFMNKKNISAYAASTAFFLFLSLIPMLMLLCALLPYTPLTEANLMSVMTGIAPDTVDSLIIRMIADVYDKSVGVISVTAVITLWSAGKGILALLRGLNAVNDVEEKRNYFVLRFVASFYTILILVLMLLSLLILVFGNLLIILLQNHVPQTSYLFDLLFHFRILFVWLMITVVISTIYAYVPGKRMVFKKQIPGAMVAAVGWSFITWGFSAYVNHFDGFDTYGSLTTIIILMLWLYACMYMVMAGALLNRYLDRAKRLIKGK